MTTKIIQYELEARNSLLRGINKLNDAVKVTLGPRGRNAIIAQPSTPPVITQNGTIIAAAVELPDTQEQLGIQVLKDIADRTSTVTGDGTTTAILLAQSIIEAGLTNIRSGTNATELKIGIDKAVEAVVAHLASQSNAINTESEIKQVATIAANNDSSIGNLITSAIQKVGKDGVILVDEANDTESSVIIKSGMQFKRGHLSEDLSTNGNNGNIKLENAYILITDQRVSDRQEPTRVLNQINSTNRSLLIIADGFDGEVVSWFKGLNSLNNTTNILGIKAPGLGDHRHAILQDIAIYTSGTVISERKGYSLSSAAAELLGHAEKVFTNHVTTTLVGGGGTQQDVTARISQLRLQIQQASTAEDRDKLQERLHRLASGVAVLNIGGATEQAMYKQKQLVELALKATQTAIQEGVVPGGGVAYIRAQQSLANLKNQHPDQQTAINIIRDALEAPLRCIATNAGTDPEDVVKKVKGGQHGFGYNAQTGAFEDLAAAGIVDPTKVMRTAIEHAGLFGGLVLTTDVCISDKL